MARFAAIDPGEELVSYQIDSLDLGGIVPQYPVAQLVLNLREQPLEVGFPCGGADVTEAGGEDALLAKILEARTAGATVMNVSLRSDSLAHYLDQLAGIAERVAPRVG